MTEKRQGRRVVREPTEEERLNYQQAIAEGMEAMEANKKRGRKLVNNRCEGCNSVPGTTDGTAR